jgi:uncharacterized protein (TIGR00369 family)
MAETEQREEHHRRLERMYLDAPVNAFYRPTIRVDHGTARITTAVRFEFFHSAHAVHGSVCFKLLDDAAFFAVGSLVTDVFVVTVAFDTHLLRPVNEGVLVAEGRVVHPSPKLWVADSELRDGNGRLVATGRGTFVPSRIPLDERVGYR